MNFSCTKNGSFKEPLFISLKKLNNVFCKDMSCNYDILMCKLNIYILQG